MVRIRCALEIGQVAADTGGVRTRQVVVVVDVALRALNRGMCPGQGESGDRVIKSGRRIPRARAMTILASCWEPHLRMRRIIRLVEVRHMAADAGCRRQRELSTRVTSAAIQSRMRPGQRKIRWRSGVIELRTQPVVHGVALLARGREASLNVIQADGLRIHEIPLVARNALRRQSLELTHRRALVTGVAIHRGVRADQREAIQVLVDLLHGNVPALYGVALLAVGAHLALVNIRVAVCAFLAHVCEHGLDVALGTGHSFVHAAQGIFRGVVVEFRDRSDRLPAA